MSPRADSQIYNPQAMLEEHYRDTERPAETDRPAQIIYALDALERSGGAIGHHLALPEDWVNQCLAAQRAATPFSEGEETGMMVVDPDNWPNDYTVFEGAPDEQSTVTAHGVSTTSPATEDPASVSTVAFAATAATGEGGTVRPSDSQIVSSFFDVIGDVWHSDR